MNVHRHGRAVPPNCAVPGVERGCRRRAAKVACLPLLAVAAAILSTGCEDVRHDFFPLAPGNSWTYRIKSAGRDLGRESIRVTAKLSGSEKREGEGRGGRATFFRVQEPGGAAVWGKDRGTVVRSSGSARSVILLHPPFVGSGWTDDGPAAPGKRASRVVYCKVIAREAVETPAGWFFDCVVVRREAEDRSSIVTQWFAPDVGLVKWRVEQPGKAAVVWALEKYTVRRE